MVLSDVEGQLRFRSKMMETRHRPDLVIFSKSAEGILWWELKVSFEERIAESYEFKLDCNKESSGGDSGKRMIQLQLRC